MHKCLLSSVVFLVVMVLFGSSYDVSASEVFFSVDNTATVLELTVPSSVTLNLVPSSGSAFNTANLNIGVGTNNITGYNLSMTASSANLTRTSSITNGNNVVSTPTIPTISSTYSLASFQSSNDTINKWGYKLSTASNYGPMVTTTQTLKTTNAPSNATGTDVVLNFAAKVDTTQPAGIYQTTLNFTAVTNVAPLTCNPSGTTISAIVCMQDISSGNVGSIISSMTDNVQYWLYDSRDKTPYTVAKLADGKVWMTRNLNLAGGTALSATDTDVDASYISSFTTSNNLTKDGSTIKLPASATAGFNTDNYSYVYNSNSTTCGSGSPCYSYYSWDAATLGSGRNISTDNTDAPYSICPKGWHLPTTYNGANSTTDFRALMIALGGSGSISYYTSNTTPTGTIMSTSLQSPPNNFVLAGAHHNGSASGGGSFGGYWSATVYPDSSSSSTRLLYISSSATDSCLGDYRRNGLSVRCVLNP